MLGKSWTALFFQWFVVPECSKSKLAEAAGAEVGNSREMKNGTPLWGEAHLQVKISKNTSGSDQVWKLRCRKMARCCGGKHICKWKYPKTPQVRTRFGSYDVEKWHAAVARSTFARENAQNTSGSEQFFKFRSRKIARCCGAKHICKSKREKIHGHGPLFELPMLKSGTPLWGEAHL